MIWPISIEYEEAGVGRTWPSQGKGAPKGSVGSGERAVVSNCVRCDIISVGVVIICPVFSSRRTERSMGSVEVSSYPSEDRRMDLRVTLGFFTNMRRRALPYLTRIKLRAWRMRRLGAFLSSLKQFCAFWRVVVPTRSESGRTRTPKVPRCREVG